MKKEDLIKAIDGVQPNAYMKKRLIAKIGTDTPEHKNISKVIKTVTACCLIAAIVVSAGLYKKAPNNVDSEKNNITDSSILSAFQDAFIIVASAEDYKGEATIATKTLEVDETYPYGVYFKICDVNGMSEPDKNSLLHKMNNELNAYAGKEDFSLGRSSIVATDKLYMVICSVNEFRFVVQPDKTLKSINVKNTSSYGQMVYSSGKRDFSGPPHGDNITVTGEEFDPTVAGFYWDYTDELVSVLEKNPDTPFSTFNDTITFTLEYTDGSEFVGVVELDFSNDGSAAAVCKSYEYRRAGDNRK